MNQNLIAEVINVVEAVAPMDLSTGALTGDWVSMAKYRRLGILLHAGPGAAGEPPTITVLQAQDVAGTGSKALNFTIAYVKAAATNLAAVGNWTKVTQAAANTFVPTTHGDYDKMCWIELRDSDLDVANAFCCVSVTIADVGATAQLGTVLYFPAEPRFGPAAPDRLDSAIV